MTSEPDIDRDLADSIDINPRPLREIYLRTVASVTMARRGFVEDSVPADQQSDDYYLIETDRFELYSWSKRELHQALTLAELAILRKPAGALEPSSLDQCLDALVAAEVLSWSLGLIGELPDPTYPSEKSVERMFGWAPEPWAELQRLPKTLMVRSDQEIAHERERRELWYWRATLDPANGENDEELRTLVAETADEASLAELISIADSDFAIEGTPFSSLPDQHIASVETISRLQLHALNWVSGLGGDWESTPLFLD